MNVSTAADIRASYTQIYAKQAKTQGTGNSFSEMMAQAKIAVLKT